MTTLRTCLHTLTPLLAVAAVSAAATAGGTLGNPFSATYPNGTHDFPSRDDGGIATPSTCSFIVDDGTNENSIGLTAGGTFVFGNQFTVTSATCNKIQQIQIAWGNIPIGTAATVYVLDDPNGDGNPNDSNVVTSQAVTIASNNPAATPTPNFDSYTLTTQPTLSGNFFIAALITHAAAQNPAAIDQTAPNNGKSWIGFGGIVAADPFDTATTVGKIDSFGLPGDWHIRAQAKTGNNCLLPLPFCPADIAPGAGDDVVGIADLLGVIGSFNQVAPSGPRPLGDVTPLPNGDCQVLIGDLLAVIGAWGVCPAPTGSCCTPAGTCSVLTEAACGFANVWGGAGSVCSPNPCTPFPANDNCGGATALITGTNPINTTPATATPNPAVSCTPGMDSDLWFTYTATCTGTVTMTTQNFTAPFTDSVLVVYTGTCGSLTELECSDDISGANLASQVSFPVTSGQSFIVRVGGFINAAPSEGAFDLVISCAVPDDNNCGDATPLGALPASINGDLFGATADTVPACSGLTPTGAGRWYTVVGTGNTMTASLCNSTNFGWDSGLSVYCGDCAGLFCVDAEEGTTSGCCGGFGSCGTSFHETVSWCSTAGQVYRILVWDTSAVPPGSAGIADYTLDVSSNATPCGPAVSCAACQLTNCQDYSATIDNASNSDGVNLVVADNFHPTANGNITGICVEGVTLSGAFLTGGFEVRYFADNGSGLPGALLGTFNEGTTLTLNGVGPSGNNIAGVADAYIASFSHAAVAVTSGQCVWVEVSNAVAEAWFWVNSEDGDGVSLQDDTTGYDAGDLQAATDQSFCLNVAFDAASPCQAPPTVPPPANDECAGAEAIVVNGPADSTVIAGSGITDNATDTDSSCEIASGGPFTQDASWWYTFTLAAPTAISVTTCASDPGQDCVVTLFSGTCGALVEEACDDDTCTAPNFGPSTFNAGTLPAGTYFIRVELYAGGYNATLPVIIEVNSP